MTVVTPKFGMGASVRRVEDDAFGQGRYTDDIRHEGIKHIDMLATPSRIRGATPDAGTQ